MAQRDPVHGVLGGGPKRSRGRVPPKRGVQSRLASFERIAYRSNKGFQLKIHHQDMRTLWTAALVAVLFAGCLEDDSAVDPLDNEGMYEVALVEEPFEPRTVMDQPVRFLGAVDDRFEEPFEVPAGASKISVDLAPLVATGDLYVAVRDPNGTETVFFDAAAALVAGYGVSYGISPSYEPVAAKEGIWHVVIQVTGNLEGTLRVDLR